MNRKGLSNTGYIVIISLLFVLFTAMFTGCATQGFKPRNMAGVSRYFDADKDTVWNAVIQSAEGIPIEMKDGEKGVLRTRWIKGWSADKTTGLLLEGHWQERYRLLIKVNDEQGKTYVSVNAQVETKPPGGSQAYRWNRIPSDGAIEQEFLQKVENMLGEKLR
ncbi:MAG TPA: outer membrane protein assembly factor BamC [Candidatus Wunengus sp. YC60]|uniref:outer membrane protein assembly factor BamC n=1 Tax=Candidatus Wunengus sp. YC60 TaxID=3367697 RepID=UPI0040299AC3